MCNRRTGKIFLVLLVALLVAPASAVAGYHIIPTNADSYIKEAAPTEVHGLDIELVNKLKSGDNFRSVWRFDLSSIPAGETVVGAVAVFHVTTDSNEPVEIYRITDTWTESGANWSNLGNSYDAGTLYGAFVPDAIGPVAVDVTAIVREWVEGVHPNNGLMFLSVANDRESKYASKEWLLPSSHPQLYVRTAVLPTMRMATGSYLGNGFRPRPFTDLGFSPDLVLIKANDNTATVARTSTMYGDAAKELGPGSALLPDAIMSLDKDGFTIGSDTRVNEPGIQFYWVAFSAAPDEMVVGSYLGNGSDDRDINTLGFEPDHLIVMAESSEKAMQRYGAHLGDASREFEKSDEKTDRIQAFWADGFQVGSHNTVNDNKVTYHYVAWNATPGFIESNSYDGNDTDNRDVAGVGFRPEYIFLTARTNTYESVHRMSSMPGDATLRVNTGTVLDDQIQTFLPDGFQVGRSAAVNDPSETYLWTAFRDHWKTESDLEFKMVVNDSLPNEDDTITFALTVVNGGPNDATGIVVHDLLPVGLTYLMHFSTQGPYDYLTGVWAVGDLAAGSGAGMQITATVDPGTAGSTLVNEAKITSVDHIDPDPSNNSVSVNIHVQGVDIQASKTVNVAAPNEGDSITYRIWLTNAGPDSASGVEVMDRLPPGVTFVSDTPTQGGYTDATGRWSVGALAVGDTASLTIDATVDPGTGGSTITNTAVLVASDQTDVEAANDTASVDITVRSADVALSKFVDDTTPAETDPITFTVRLANAGPSDATGIEVTDLLPAGLSYTGQWASQGNYDDATGIWDIGTVAVTDTVTLTIDATVDIGTRGWTISNLAAVTAVDQADPDVVDNSAFAKITVQSGDFRMATGTYAGDGAGTRSITGAGFQPDLVIVQGDDNQPPSVRSLSMPGTDSKDLVRSSPSNNNVITSLDADGFTVSPDGRMNAADNNYYWIAFQSGAGYMVAGSYTGDGTDDRVVGGLGFTPGYVMILPESYNKASQRFASQTGDASILFGASSESTNWIQSFLPDGFEVGTDSLVNAPDLTYHYVAFNTVAGATAGGLHAGNGIDGFDITGLGMQPHYVSVKQRSASNGAVHRPASLGGDNTISMRNGWVFADGIQTLLPDGFEVGTSTSVNEASSQYDWYAFRDPSVPQSDLEVAMAVSDTVPIEGDTLVYNVTLHNNGPDAASGVQLIDLLPSGVTYLSDVATHGAYTPAIGLWDVGIIPVGDIATLDLLATVDMGSVDSTIINSASIVAANQADPDSTNNAISASVTVGPSRFRVVSGSYVGDGASGRAISGIGFRPDVVLIKGNSNEHLVARTSTMSGDVAKPVGVKQALKMGTVLTLDEDGFTVGTNNRVNDTDTRYYWTAFRAARPELVVGSFIGDGGDDRSISVGFEPAYVMVMNQTPDEAVQRFAAQSGDASLLFSSDDPLPDRIQAFGPDGFQVGQDASTNASGDTIHYVAWKTVAGRSEAGWYVGNGTDDRDVGGSFHPNLVLVQQSEAGSAGVFRTIANGADTSMSVSPVPLFEDRIQRFTASGFRIGASPEVNDSASTYYWVAFKDDLFLDIAVAISVDDQTPNVGDVVEFSITVVNNGPADATGVEVRDLLPAGLTYDSDSPMAGSYDSTAGVWNVPLLRAGLGTGLRLRAIVDAGTGGSTIVNNAALWLVDQLDIDAGNNSANASITVRSADLAVEIDVDESYPAEGDTIVYTVIVSNEGPDGATGVSVVDSLPFGVAYIADSTSAGIYDTTSGVWTVGVLATGEADTLLIYGLIEAGNLGSYITNTVRVAGSAVADPDSTDNVDSVTVLVPTPVALDDVDGSLFPASAFVGDPDLALRIGVDNVWAVGVMLDTLSTIRFTDGIRIFEANLANRTYVPPYANDFTLAFSSNAVPSEMMADTTYDLALSLAGVTDEGLPYAQSIPTSGTNAIFVDQPKMAVSAVLVGDAVVNPGDVDVDLLVLRFENQYGSVRTLDSLTFENTARGGGTQPQLDRLAGALKLYAGNDSSRSVADADTLLATGVYTGGRVTFELSPGWQFPALTSGTLVLAVNVDSTSARDGDVIDAVVTHDSDIVFAEPVTFAAEISPLYPLDSYGDVAIDGMVAHQIGLVPSPTDTLYSGTTDVAVLGIVIPQNAYESDTLRALDVQDFSGGFDPNDLERLQLYRDDGNGSFDADFDSPLGELVYSGDRYEITGLSTPTGPGETYFVTADVAIAPANDNTFRPGIPVGGITVASDNDGPLDAAVVSNTTYTTVLVEKIAVSSLPLDAAVPHPGDTDVSLLLLEVRNNTLQTVTLDSLRLANTTSGTGTRAQLDGELAGVHAYVDDGNGVVDSWDTAIASGNTFSSGFLTMGHLGYSLDPGEFVQLLVAGDVDSICARDPDSLGVQVASAADVYFDSSPMVAGSFPIETDAARAIDGMMSFQIGVYPSSDSLLITQTTDILVLDFAIPANGYEGDTLTSLHVENLGSATDEHFRTVNLWADGGDGAFDAGAGDDTWLASLVSLGLRQYQRSGLAHPLTGSCVGGGTRFYVSCDLTLDYMSSATVQFSVPAKSIGVTSTNDGPIDGAVIDPSTGLIPRPDELTIFPYSVGDKRVYPGTSNNLNFGVGLYNGFMTSRSLDAITLFRDGLLSKDEIIRLTAFADADTNGLFDPLIDTPIATTPPSSDGFDTFSGLGLELTPQKITYLFVAYDLELSVVRDSVDIDIQLRDKAHLVLTPLVDPDNIEPDFKEPVNSPGVDFTDGMVAAQIAVRTTPADRAAPGDQHVLAMDLAVPSNGTIPDEFSFLTILNVGDAVAGQDIDRFDLWAESSISPDGFDPLDDRLLATMVWSGSGWRNTVDMSEPVPSGGLRCYVTFSTALTASDDRTVQALLPVGGIEVLSGNDGPVDVAVSNPNVQTISTDPLITTILTDRDSYSTAQEIVVSMRVRNKDTDSLMAVGAPAPSIVGDGSAVYVDGPIPAAVDLPPGTDTTLVWHYAAATAGVVQFCGYAHNGDHTEESIETCTPAVTIQDKPVEVAMVLADVVPVAVNRGQHSVEAITLELTYSNYTSRSAPAVFGGIDISVEDGGGTPIAPNTVLDEITIVSSTGSNQPFAVADSVSNPLRLYLDETVGIERGDSVTLDIDLDIAAGAVLSPFRLSIQSAAAIDVADANDGAAVPLTTGAAFPWVTNVVDVEVPAESLLVSANNAGTYFVNNGQEQVEAFRFTLLNNGQAQTASEILKTVVLSFHDSTGVGIAPADIVRNLTLSSGVSELYFTDVIPSVGSEIVCDLDIGFLLPAQTARDVLVTVDLKVFPLQGGFYASLASRAAITARDNNEGGFVFVDALAPSAFPIESPTFLFQQPASGLSTDHASLVPRDILPATSSVPLIDITYSHADSAASSIVIDSLAMAFIDHSGNPLFPGDYFSQMCVVHAGDTLAALTSLSSVSHIVQARLDPPVSLEPMATDSFRLYLSSKGVYSPTEFQVRVDREHVVAYDANTGERILSIDGEFPFFSDYSRLQLAGDAVAGGLASLLPPNVTGRESGLPAFDFVLRNDNPPGYTSSELRGLTVTMRNWKGAGLNPTEYVSGATLALGDSILSAATIDASGIAFVLPGGVVVTGPGAADSLTVSVDLAASGTETFRFAVADTSDIDVRDAVTGGPIAAGTIGDTGYPLTSALTHVLGSTGDNAFSNYPNPFAAGREVTRITFYLEQPSRVTLRLYTLWGAPVKTLVDSEARDAGLHQDVEWIGRTGDGDVVNNGVYYLVLDVEPTGGGSSTSWKRKVGVVR